MSLERKTVGAVLKASGDDGSFEAAIATFGELDHDRDIVMPGAFDGATASVLPSHNQDHVPLGKTSVQESGRQAIAVGKFNLEIQAAKEWHSAIKFDLANPPAVQEWSWGFRPLKESFEQRDGQRVRLLHKVDLREVSPVLRGASIGTGTLSIKSESVHETATSSAPWDSVAHERRLVAAAEKSGAYALIKGEDGYFLHHEVGEEGTPIGPANIHACLAGIATLKGVRGSCLLTDETRQGVYDHLAGHLKDAGIEPPELGDKPGIKMVDQIRLATWDARAVIERIHSATLDRKLGQEAKSLSLELAKEHAALMDELKALAEGMLPEDQAARAAARFLASEAAKHLEE